MMTLEINNLTIQLEVAKSFWKRFLGLMGKKKLPEGQGLLLTDCNNIHMCFMRFSIDVIYIDKDFQIKKIVRSLKPWIGFSICLSADSTIELAAGEAKRLSLEVGQKFKIIDER